VRILIVSGIWPPDVGGPASHAPELADFLLDRGHDVEVVTTADARPAARPYPVHWVSREIPKGVIHARSAVEVARRAREADVVYTTGMFSRSVAGATLVRRPSVVKLTGDPAFERIRARGGVTGDVAAFQHGGGGLEGDALRVLRSATLRLAAHVVCPSVFLRDLALTWGVEPERATVVPNALPTVSASASSGQLRDRLDLNGTTLAFVGRLGPQKALDVAVEAVSAADGVTLLVVGEGPDRARLEGSAGDRVRFLGALPRQEVLDVLAASDALLLSSSWENLPHTVMEALGVGTPVIATSVGGVPELVTDGVNGLLVEPGDVEGLTAAIRRFYADAELRERLRAASAPSVSRYAPEAIYGQLEEILRRCAR
jgi:glycosyltransferase involved in cell wall biosynthesis